MNFVKENRGTVIDLNGLIPGRELLLSVLIKMGFFIRCFQRKKGCWYATLLPFIAH
jgi:hypothetical protein